MKVNKLKNGLLSASILLLSTSWLTQAQNNVLHLGKAQIKDYNDYTKLPAILIPDPVDNLDNQKLNDWALNAFGIQAGSSFKAYHSETDELGITHIKYKQYYKGFPVEGTMLVTHGAGGMVTMVNGDYLQNFNNKTTITVTEKEALSFALKKVKAKKYMWEDKAMQEIHEKDYLPKAELVFVHKKGADYTASNVRLAYKFDIYAEEPLYRAYVFVDAQTGEILDENNRICTIDTQGTAVTKYSGTVTMTSDNNAGSYRLRETGRGNGIVTKNLQNGTNYGSAVDFTNVSANWNVTGTNQAAADAHWGAEKTYDYFMNTFNRNSIDGNGYALNSYVHYSTNFVNAFWDGTEMTYGDGNTSQGFSIMTALDVCGHEITHGLVSNTANLGSGEAGALNEGFADIFGTTIEFYARPNQCDWKMGADIMTNHVGIRNMANPNSIQQPDTYQGTYWDNAGEVHTNDGPCIYWYYLMCQGGSGTNDNGNAFNVSAIGMSDAAKIAYRALTVYFTSSTNYANARTYSIQAATDLFGSCSPQTIACTNAWYAVGVGSAYAAPTLASAFSANQTTSCTLPTTVTFNNTTSGGASYTWYFGDGTTSTLANPTHTYTQAGTYSVKLVSQGCTTSRDSLTKTNYIVINPPTAPATNGASRCGSGTVTLTASGTGTLNWYDAASGGNLLYTGTSFTTPSLSSTTTYYVSSLNQPAAANGGPALNTTLGAGGYLNTEHYLIFNATNDMTILEVDIYANSTGVRTIDLRNSSGTTLSTYTVNITATGKTTVPVNFHVTAGTGYRLVATGNINLYRNNAGASYPINVASLASITGTDVSATNPAYYYYFYNWKVQKDGCYSSTTPVTATINQNANVQVNSPVTCAGSQVTLLASGGSTYQWSNGSTGSSINVSPTSTTVYTVTSSVSGCGNVSATSTVTVNQLPNVTITSPQSGICVGQNITLTGNGAVNYSWNTGNTASTLVVTPSNTTTYTLTGTDANNCSKTVTKTITVNPLPTVTVSANNNNICVGNSTVISASGAVSYQWSNGSSSTSITVNPVSSDSYTVTGTDANNCVNTAMQQITVNPLPIVAVSSSQNTICAGASITLTASGAINYQWSDGSTNSSITVTPSAATNYTVTGTDANNCSNTATQQITVNNLPVIAISTSQNTICAGSNTTLSATGANSYQWSDGSNSNSISVSPAVTTSYSVTGIDANGCSNVATQMIDVNPLPIVALTADNDSVCSNYGLVTLTGTPAGGIYNGPAVNNNTFDPQTSGIGTFTINYNYSDGNGCINTSSVDLYVSGCVGLAGPAEQTITLYPNPTVNTLHLKHEAEISFDIYDQLGKLIMQAKLNIGEETIDITNLSTGIYTLQFKETGINNIRFMVQK